MKVRYASHCSYRIRYHMVFVLKYRKDLISDLVFNELKDILEGIALRYHLSFQAWPRDIWHRDYGKRCSRRATELPDQQYFELPVHPGRYPAYILPNEKRSECIGH